MDIKSAHQLRIIKQSQDSSQLPFASSQLTFDSAQLPFDSSQLPFEEILETTQLGLCSIPSQILVSTHHYRSVLDLRGCAQIYADGPQRGVPGRYHRRISHVLGQAMLYCSLLDKFGYVNSLSSRCTWPHYSSGFITNSFPSSSTLLPTVTWSQ